MPYLLNLVYVVLLCAASPWLLWSAIRKGKYRRGYAEKLLGRVPHRDDVQPCIWFHAVSAGEVILLEALLQRFRRDLPNWKYVISTTTNTGYEIAKKRYPELTVFFCPLDFSWSVRTALRRVRPDMLVLAELELWPNLIREARRVGVKVALVNGRLSERSARGYARIRWLIAPLLRSLDVIAVQTTEYAERFVDLGADRRAVEVTGSMKFDGAVQDRDNGHTQRLAKLAGIASSDVVFLAGSTQAPEEALAIDSFRTLKDEFPDLRLILVPRHPERFAEVAQLLDQSGLAWQRRSDLAADRLASARVLLIDTMGELAAWWGVADIGYVGGSMGSRGGQSMIEPAAFGLATSFGPKTHNFKDVVRLMLQRDAAVVVDSGTELTAFVRRCLVDVDWRGRLGVRASELVAKQMGAADVTLTLLKNQMPGERIYREAA